MGDYVWVLQNFDTGAEHAFVAQHLAMHCAERMVGNRACAGPLGEDMTMLYGIGDGTTSVMIRRFRREDALKIFPELTLPVGEG